MCGAKKSVSCPENVDMRRCIRTFSRRTRMVIDIQSCTFFSAPVENSRSVISMVCRRKAHPSWGWMTCIRSPAGRRKKWTAGRWSWEQRRPREGQFPIYRALLLIVQRKLETIFFRVFACVTGASRSAPPCLNILCLRSGGKSDISYTTYDWFTT